MIRCDPHQLGLGARGLQLLALPEVGGEGHHLAAVGRLQPFQDDAGVEPSRIGKDDALDGLGHGGTFWRETTRARLAGQPARRKGLIAQKQRRASEAKQRNERKTDPQTFCRTATYTGPAPDNTHPWGKW